MMPQSDLILTLHWLGGIDGHLRLIDQTKLPTEFVEIDCRTVEQVWEAIKSLRVRGAPAIGIAAAFGVVVGVQVRGTRSASGKAEEDRLAERVGHAEEGGNLRQSQEEKRGRPAEAGTTNGEFFARLHEVCDYLASSRPTAVNLFWALDRMKRVAKSLRGQAELDAVRRRLLDEAKAIQEEDRQMCRAIGRCGAELIADGSGVLTHCNAGGLATADYGTALAVFFAAHEAGKTIHVFADETRPLLQGARLTAWELMQRGIDVTLICDSMAAQVMREGKVAAVVTGADRIAANGDAANKIGTYSVALAAAAHGIPFYVAAPSSTFDLTLDSGDAIPIEQRAAEEITHGFGRQTAPDGVKVYNPAFDVTPARLITALICERGVIRPVTRERIAAVLGAGS